MGCGTGIIACTLAAEVPRLQVKTTDVNPRAVELARSNAKRLGVAARVEVLEGRLLEPVPEDLKGRAHLLVSNPPYIRSGDLPGLPREVRDHDPAEALDGGPDGLHFYHEFARRAGEWLAPGGRVVVEIGEDQGDQVSAIFAASGLGGVRVIEDYARRPRVVAARLADFTDTED